MYTLPNSRLCCIFRWVHGSRCTGRSTYTQSCNTVWTSKFRTSQLQTKSSPRKIQCIYKDTEELVLRGLEMKQIPVPPVIHHQQCKRRKTNFSLMVRGRMNSGLPCDGHKIQSLILFREQLRGCGLLWILNRG